MKGHAACLAPGKYLVLLLIPPPSSDVLMISLLGFRDGDLGYVRKVTVTPAVQSSGQRTLGGSSETSSSGCGRPSAWPVPFPRSDAPGHTQAAVRAVSKASEGHSPS